MRAVLDPNVLISALLSRRGAPAGLLERWLAGEFELVVSASLLAELERALAYPRLRKRIDEGDARAFLGLLRDATVVADPPDPPERSPDRGDDYLIALAEAAPAYLVSGDGHLLGVADRFPILAPAEFLELLDR